MVKRQSADCPLLFSSDEDSCSQLIIDIVSAVFDGNGATAPSAGDHRNGLAAVAPQREQKGIQLFVIGLDGPDNIFFAKLGSGQVHSDHPIPKYC